MNINNIGMSNYFYLFLVVFLNFIINIILFLWNMIKIFDSVKDNNKEVKDIKK